MYTRWVNRVGAVCLVALASELDGACSAVSISHLQSQPQGACREQLGRESGFEVKRTEDHKF